MVQKKHRKLLRAVRRRDCDAFVHESTPERRCACARVVSMNGIQAFQYRRSVHNQDTETMAPLLPHPYRSLDTSRDMGSGKYGKLSSSSAQGTSRVFRPAPRCCVAVRRKNHVKYSPCTKSAGGAGVYARFCNSTQRWRRSTMPAHGHIRCVPITVNETRTTGDQALIVNPRSRSRERRNQK